MRRSSFVVGFILLLSTWGSAAVAEVKKCSESFMAKLREASSEGNDTIKINCHVTLNPGDLISKRVVFEGPAASGVIFDCRGGKIQFNGGGDDLVIQSKTLVDANGIRSWQRPADITVKNCQIMGSIRIRGMAPNGEGEFLRESSRLDAKHTVRAQANAPTRVTLDNLSIVGAGRIPLYISPGSTYITVKNSKFTGKSSSVVLYMDTESAHNVIQNNTFVADTEKREVMAVDASANNTIVGNYFSGLENGGIYLYRNCGEGGTVRHQSPQRNQIINNTFFYKKYHGGNPSIFLASRNGNRGYCNDDAGFPWGSSVSNNDFARNNVIVENQIFVLDPLKMIRNNDSSNTVVANQKVSKRFDRPSSCYSFDESRVLAHGASSLQSRGEGRQQTCHRVTCQDGVLSANEKVTCPDAKVVDFSCKVSGSNSGCTKTVACPAGFRIQDVKAVCDLEMDSVAAKMEDVPWGRLIVERESDERSDGACSVNEVRVSTGAVDLSVRGQSSIKVHCSERDRNGGECEIKGQVRCGS